jgi:uncharacterized membrane protein (DUF4010 family)
MSELQQTLYHLGVALAIGLLIGVERGWKARGVEEGERVAGVRTYGLTGLLGGASALLAKHFGSPFLGLAFIGMLAAFTTVYVVNLRREDDAGITSLITGVLTFGLGALAASGEIIVAAAAAVVTTLLLSYKPLLHRWVRALEEEELRAGIKLLLISVVLLPILPNHGFGPWQALNPYAIWWMVVLVATLSFLGYFAIKVGGARRGAVFTGLFGGLASSTALTLHFARVSRQSPDLAPMLGLGIVLAGVTMLPRLLLVAVVLNRDLFIPVLVPAVVMGLLLCLPIPFLWRSPSEDHELTSPLKNPLELGAALSFGVVLAVILFLGEAMRSGFGNGGVIAFAAASGIVNLDAVTLSLASMSDQNIGLGVAASGIVIAASINNLAKGLAATVLGGRTIALRSGLPLAASAIGGLVSVWLWVLK